MNSFVVISGCSGGGKSTLLAELAARGHRVVEEPGRRVVEREQETGGTALPWTDMRAFLDKVLALAEQDLAEARAADGWVFFDRGVIDAVTALAHVTGHPLATWLKGEKHYTNQVFLAPPWPEIYKTDSARRHGFDEAVAEYDRLQDAFEALEYDVVHLPKIPLAERADFLCRHLLLD
ncbi:AAA family ATPase [Roseobacter sp.]|uniref:AAA family ATPase n=1 Tax=Roseobacter sp. TaxID=1907202 RepID=UPI002966B29B|nr:AAA family ATPase [Roseobacter sp.]MDW3183894.1 AAA family ATPase [Roseobacter sp.]